MDKLFGLPVAIDPSLDVDKMFIGHKQQLPPIKTRGITATEMLEQMAVCVGENLHDTLLDAAVYGVGHTYSNFDSIERLTGKHLRMRGSNKPLWPMMYMWNEASKHTVKYDLDTLQTAQTSTGPGKDPLFEAMDKHNQLIKLGRKAIHEMFHATPLNLNQKSTGPYKAKDWE